MLRQYNGLDTYYARREWYLADRVINMCVDGGVICIPVAIKVAAWLGLGGIATKVWHKCHKAKVT